MNTWQTLRQIQYLVRARKWTGSSNVVFHTDSVLVTSGPREEALEKIILPAVMFRPLGNTPDPEKPDALEQEVAATLAVGHAGDAFGQYTLLGGQRTSQTRSQGRGLLEIEEELFAAIELLNTDDGLVIQLRASSAVEAQYVNEQYVAFRDYLFRLNVTADRYYHPVMNLVAT